MSVYDKLKELDITLPPVATPAARRVENRVIGADANPYLAMAATLACGYLGMVQGLTPTEPMSGSAWQMDHELPRHLEDAIERMRGCEALADVLGHRPRIVIGKPGLDGHSNGAEVIAVSARHVGFDVIYSGIRLSPDEIVQSAVEEDADVIGASVLSGSHLELAQQIFDKLAEYGASGKIEVVVGGIIPPADVEQLTAMGVRRVFTPSDYELIDIMESIVGLIEARSAPAAAAGARRRGHRR